MSMAEITIGQIYEMNHCRFGKAVVKATDIIDETWLTVEVMFGVLRGINDSWFPGDTKTVRRSHCTFTIKQ